MNAFKDILSLLNLLQRRRKLQLSGLIGLMIIGALAELLSIGAVIPFLAILAQPEVAMGDPTFLPFLSLLGGDDLASLRWGLTALFALAAISAAGLRLLVLFVAARLNFAIAHDLGSQIYRNALHQPYCVHLMRNSSDVIGAISKVDAVAGVIYGLLTALSAAIIAIFILAALLWVEPAMSSVAIVFFGVLYLSIGSLVNKKLRSASQLIGKSYNLRVKELQEGLGGIRDVLLDHAQPVFSGRFDGADNGMRRAQATVYFLGPSPRFVVEGFGMAVIAVAAYYFTRTSPDIRLLIPSLGALVLGAQRLMPLVQQIYQGWVNLTGSRDLVSDILVLARESQPEKIDDSQDMLAFRDQISINELFFAYSGRAEAVLAGVNLLITKGLRVGIIGETGSGKSTLMDLLLGLLLPSSGNIMIDSCALTPATQKSWQRTVAHVPQNVFLNDANFAENIAFGVEVEDIDMERVKRAALRANISDFIEACAQGYSTQVGERGGRLSGGQRQRLGIARAFYKEASVLIFDEATSALDNATEQSVMSAIANLSRDTTVVLIAHRISTLEVCDVIYRLQDGRLSLVGSYKDLTAETYGH